MQRSQGALSPAEAERDDDSYRLFRQRVHDEYVASRKTTDYWCLANTDKL